MTHRPNRPHGPDGPGALAGHVALTVDGRYLHLDESGDALRAGRASLEPDAVFQRLDLGHGRIALRTLDGRFLATRPDTGLGFGICAEEELTAAASFEEVLWPDGRVSLRSCHLTYVGTHPGTHPDAPARVTANRVEAGPGERFLLVDVPTVPAQRQSSTPRATSASPSASAWRNDRMISGTA